MTLKNHASSTYKHLCDGFVRTSDIWHFFVSTHCLQWTL